MKAVKFIILVLNWISLVFCVLYMIVSGMIPGYFSDSVKKIIPIIIILLQIILTFIGAIYEYSVDKQLKTDNDNCLSVDDLKTQVYSEVEYARQELRCGINIMLGLYLIFIFVFLLFTGQIYIAVSLALLGVVVYIYADYIPHSIYYAKKYDRLEMNRVDNHYEKASSIRGLARIYLDEYLETKFNSEDSLYEKINKLEDVKDIEFIKFFCWSYIDDLTTEHVVVSVGIIIANVLSFFPETYIGIVKPIISEKLIFRAILLFVSIIASFIFFLNTDRLGKDYENNQKKVYDILKKLSTKDNERIHEYYKDVLMNLSKSNLYYVRARYMYTMKKIEYGEIKDVPLNFRMLYVHKCIANIPRLKNTMILLVIISKLLIINYFGLSIFIILPFLMGILFYIVIGKNILPSLGKRKISRECNKLI